MENKITIRQNENRAIEYLAAQRQIYNEVKKFASIINLFFVIFPLFLSLIQLYFLKNTFLDMLSKILAIISMLIGIYVDSFVKKNKEDAATIQQLFDVYVYQMSWDNKLFGKKKNLSALIAKKSKVLLNREGEKEKLMNWYTKGVGNVSNIKGILMCQKENFSWDVELRKKYKKDCLILFIILIVGEILLGLIRDEAIRAVMDRIIFILPMLRLMITTFKQLDNDIQNMQEIDELINSSEEKNMEDLQEIQSKLYIHRKSCYVIPNFFYNKYKDNAEDLAHRIAMLDE